MSAQLQRIREIMTVDVVEPVEGDPIAEQLQKLDEAINNALSNLSARQEKFVLEYAKCGNGAEAVSGLNGSSHAVIHHRLASGTISKPTSLCFWFPEAPD